jgi:hypothetical protein
VTVIPLDSEQPDPDSGVEGSVSRLIMARSRMARFRGKWNANDGKRKQNKAMRAW